MFALVTMFGWWLSTTSINRLLFGEAGWNYAFHTVFILVPVPFLLLDWSRAESYGVTLKHWRSDLQLGVALVALLFVPGLLADFLLGELELAPQVASRGILNTLLFLAVFVAVAEEFLYRGFFQGEFNRVLGRPCTLRRAKFGVGLFVTSLLFGIAHLLNPFNPLRDQYSLDWIGFAATTALALLLGLVRERTGGLIAVSLVHLGVLLFVRLFVVTPYSGSALILAWLVSLGVLLRYILGRREAAEPA